jgi:hypothetical protein
LDLVGRFSLIGKTKKAEPLVVRTVNSGGGMSLIQRDPLAAEQSKKEFHMLEQRYGIIPW